MGTIQHQMASTTKIDNYNNVKKYKLMFIRVSPATLGCFCVFCGFVLELGVILFNSAHLQIQKATTGSIDYICVLQHKV